MGTDINMYAEVRRGGRWFLAEPLVQNQVCIDGSIFRGQPEWTPKSVYNDRNYSLFAMLADVGNPIRSVTKFEIISKPRGLPRDVSPELMQFHAAWENDAFAESWLLLDELEKFDWHGKEILRRGVVNPAVAHLFPPGRRGFPEPEWPEGLPISVGNQGVGAEVRWTETYAEAAGESFLNNTVSLLRGFGSPDNVRIVFWFDA